METMIETGSSSAKGRLNLYFPPHIIRRLRLERVETGKPVSAIVEGIVVAHYGQANASESRADLGTSIQRVPA